MMSKILQKPFQEHI